MYFRLLYNLLKNSLFLIFKAKRKNMYTITSLLSTKFIDLNAKAVAFETKQVLIFFHFHLTGPLEN